MHRLGVVLLLAAWAAGCAQPQATPVSEYLTIDKGPRRDDDAATRGNEQALALLAKGDLGGAEQSARGALVADVTFGPAHNTLGMVYYRRRQLYLAAWEFQYAIKLMPRQAETKNNLGLVYEAGGKLDQAADSYGEALALSPDDEQYVGNLVRVRVRRGDAGEDLRELLTRVAARDSRPEWAEWARGRLLRFRAAGSVRAHTSPREVGTPSTGVDSSHAATRPALP